MVEFYNQVRTEFEQNGRSAAPTPAGTLRPLAPPEKPFAYFFIFPAEFLFLKLKRVFSDGGVSLKANWYMSYLESNEC